MRPPGGWIRSDAWRWPRAATQRESVEDPEAALLNVLFTAVSLGTGGSRGTAGFVPDGFSCRHWDSAPWPELPSRS